MSFKTLNLIEPLYQYLLSVSLREPDVLKKLREETAKLPQYYMQISPEQGQFMALLIELMGAKRTLDIGTYTGYSALVVALALPKEGEVITCDIDKSVTQIAQKFWQQAGVANKIKLYTAPALETLDIFISEGQKESFDFAFVDADKNNYPNYYERCLQLIRPGGLILFDNTLRNGSVADPAIQDKATVTIRALNEKLHADQRVTISLLPVGDGLTIARKR